MDDRRLCKSTCGLCVIFGAASAEKNVAWLHTGSTVGLRFPLFPETWLPEFTKKSLQIPSFEACWLLQMSRPWRLQSNDPLCFAAPKHVTVDVDPSRMLKRGRRSWQEWTMSIMSATQIRRVSHVSWCFMKHHIVTGGLYTEISHDRGWLWGFFYNVRVAGVHRQCGAIGRGWSSHTGICLADMLLHVFVVSVFRFILALAKEHITFALDVQEDLGRTEEWIRQRLFVMGLGYLPEQFAPQAFCWSLTLPSDQQWRRSKTWM